MSNHEMCRMGCGAKVNNRTGVCHRCATRSCKVCGRPYRVKEENEVNLCPRHKQNKAKSMKLQRQALWS